MKQNLQCKRINFQHENCDTVRYLHLDISLVYDTELPKPLEMFEWYRWKKYFIVSQKKHLLILSEYFLMRWPGWAPRELQDGSWLPEEPIMWLERWNIQVDPPKLLGQKRDWKLSDSPIVNDLINDETSIKPPWAAVHRDPQSWTTLPPAGRVAMPNSMGTEAPLLGLCPELTQNIPSSGYSFVFFKINWW